MLGDDIVQALQAQPATSGELAARFGVSSRHIRRTIADIILGRTPRPEILEPGTTITATRDGRSIKYVVVVEAAASSSSSITTPPGGIADNRGHEIADMSAIDCGHGGYSGEKITDTGKNSGHDCGHADLKTTKQRHRNNKRNPKGYGPAAIGPDPAPGFHPPLTCQDNGTNLCPQFYAGYERDKIQFVIVDRIFHDLIVSKADQWTTRRPNGQFWVYPQPALTLQVGKKDSVVFYSADPGEDMSAIAAWVTSTFPEYGDLDGLVKRIKHPQTLVAEELTIVVHHKETIEAIRSSIGKLMVNGTYDVQHPSESIPGLKIYESRGTMRVEFVVHNHKTGASAVDMREELMWLMPRIQRTPGLFWEFVQKYYSALHHPLIIDTGGHEFLGMLEKVTDKFTATMEAFAAKIPQVPTRQASLDDERFQDVEVAIAEFQAELELEDIIRVFQRTLKLEERATRVFLAAWASWQARNFRGQVLKEDVAAMLIRQGSEPLTLAEIAEAIVRLKAARLLQEDTRLEIRFSPGAVALCRKMMASREGIR